MLKRGSKQKPADDAAEAKDPNLPYQTDEADKVKARKWFTRAKELVDNRNYDFAIQCYIEGLALWPEAVEEAHQPLRACAAARQHTGGKKPGLGDTMKYSVNHKDPLKAMLNAERLLAMDLTNVGYLEAIFKNANKAHCDETMMWVGPLLKSAAEAEKKPSSKRFLLMKEGYEELGDRAQGRGNVELAVRAFECAIEALNIIQRLNPKDSAIPNERRDLSTKLTIIRGKYDTSGSFTESIRDADAQAEVQDKERLMQSSDRLDQLIARAEEELAKEPDSNKKVWNLIDLLCREDNEAHEMKAIGILVERFKEADEYRFKAKADDIRIRQLTRAARVAAASGDKEAAKEARSALLRHELTTYAERCKKYPNDLRSRFEYGNRLFQARKFDDAIPVLQQARSDAKTRSRSDLFLGRCFFEKSYYQQAISTLSQALEAKEISDDDTGKAMQYWLARSQEAEGLHQEARQGYGQLLQLDYNYRDVRARMDALIK